MFRSHLRAAALLPALAAALLPAVALVPTSVLAATTAPLGDLTAFRTITVDTKALVDKGELVAAKARIKDLETAWDNAESTLYPKSKPDWTELDKSIDIALAALRAKPQDQARCETALTNLLGTMSKLGG